MTRRCCAVLALSWWAWAAAHGTSIPHELLGVRPCVDDASIDVRFERGGDTARRAVTERIERALRSSFDAAALPWSRRPRCDADSDYLSIVLHVWPADDFAPRASAYDLAVQVGTRVERADGTTRAMPASAFDLSVRELFDERAVGVPAVVFLPAYVEAGLRDLTVSWWEDHLDALPASATPVWLPWLGTLLAVVVATAVWRGSAVVRRSARPEQAVRHRAERQHRERRGPDQADTERERAQRQRQRERQLHQHQREQHR